MTLTYDPTPGLALEFSVKNLNAKNDAERAGWLADPQFGATSPTT